jgi:hypothetical protein
MCHDEAFMEWTMAFLRQEAPSLTRVGLSYMLQGSGELGADGKQTVGPHVMMALPTLEDGAGIPKAKHSDAPYIAYGGSPYALVIVPVAAAGERLQLKMQE